MQMQGRRRGIFCRESAPETGFFGNFGCGRRLMGRGAGRTGYRSPVPPSATAGEAAAGFGAAGLQMLKDRAERMKKALQDIEARIHSYEQQ
jgi:hypothetical protein